jgi:predicted nucleotidyltransferase
MKTVRMGSNTSPQDASLIRIALSELQSALRKIYGEHAPVLLLYGSYARGDASVDSDVDVVLLYSRDIQPGKEIYQLREILSTLNLRYQILISVLPVSVKQYQNAKTAFWKNVQREAVPFDRI